MYRHISYSYVGRYSRCLVHLCCVMRYVLNSFSFPYEIVKDAGRFYYIIHCCWITTSYGPIQHRKLFCCHTKHTFNRFSSSAQSIIIFYNFYERLNLKFLNLKILFIPTVQQSEFLIFFLISAAECKEKWRNLRIVYMRKMKPPSSGAGAKRKSYYLENAMHFCLPFIKTSAPLSSEICHQYHSTLLVKLLKTQKYGRIVHPKWIHHKHLYLHKHHSLTLQYIHRFNIVIQPRIQHHLNKQLIHRYSFHRPLKPRKNYL